jgi:hypothetical protein
MLTWREREREREYGATKRTYEEECKERERESLKIMERE